MFPWRPLPPFRQSDDCYRATSAALLPPKRMRVSEAAERYLEIVRPGYHGPYRLDQTPYMRLPMDLCRSRDYEAVIFVGPAQVSGKTEALVNGVITHAVTCDPIDMMVVQMTQAAARDFSQTKLDALIRNSREVGSRLSSNKSDDNIFDKRFAGMLLRVTWPTVTELSSKSVPVVIFTDYDRMPKDIGGEGPPFKLGQSRTDSFGSLGMVIAESSPKAVFEGHWELTGHEAPPVQEHGILSLYNLGDRRRLYWQCPHVECGEWFEPTFGLLRWPEVDSVTGRALSNAEKAHRVFMACPHCGAEIEEKWKNWRFEWLREGETIDRHGVISGTARHSTIASLWMFAPAGGNGSWAQVVRKVLDARDESLRIGSDEPLMAVTNLNIGDCFIRTPPEDADALDKKTIAARAESSWDAGTVPEGVRAIVCTVDVNGSWFDVQFSGVGPSFEKWVITREQIAQVGDRKVSPGSYPEDWDLLLPMLERRFPLASDPARGMGVLTMVVDSGGAPGVTGNAYEWLLKCRKAGIGEDRLMLLKGDSKVGVKRIAIGKVDFTKSGRLLAGGRKLLMVGTDALKDDVSAALRRAEPGPGYVHTPHDLPAEWYDEVTAEVRDRHGNWDKRTSTTRNEAFDHEVYCRATLLRPPFKWDRIDWSRPPPWAESFNRNPLVAARDVTSSPRPAAATSSAALGNQGGASFSTGRRRQWRSSYMG